MQNFKQYQRKGLSEIRSYVKGEDLSNISVSSTDNPEEDMGYVARNPENHNDQWYVSKKYFEDNLEEVAVNKRGFYAVDNGTHYQLPTWEVKDGKGIVETGFVLDLKFVRGSKLGEEEVVKAEGVLHETLLSVMIHDLKFKNKLVPSRETATTITLLEEALHWQEERQKAREAAGVVGTYQPHIS